MSYTQLALSSVDGTHVQAVPRVALRVASAHANKVTSNMIESYLRANPALPLLRKGFMCNAPTLLAAASTSGSSASMAMDMPNVLVCTDLTNSCFPNVLRHPRTKESQRRRNTHRSTYVLYIS